MVLGALNISVAKGLKQGNMAGKGKLYPNAVKPVCNNHLSNEIYYLWLIQ